ncbi:MAG: B12-binding domain-containing radical SAM protein [Deltaproteobacteria bacterium]|nr:B12-binding domain-containing radical SAM protein [Deltaproteobacteria bacterium]
MARVALVNLPFQEDVAAVAQTSVGPPMGLAYLAAVLREAGHTVGVLDANAVRRSMGDVGRELLELKPDVVGTTAATPSITLADRLGQMVHRLFARPVPVVVGGPHGSALPEQTLEQFQGIDVVVIGEGESIAHRLVSHLAEGELPLRVPGVAFRRPERRKNRGAGPEIQVNPPAPPVQDLDRVPFPARDLLPNHRYRTIDAWPTTCMVAMRGCPAGCRYCNVPRLAGRSVRRRSPQNVVAEMTDVSARYRVRHFSFLDDTFTTSRTWVESLCQALMASGLAGDVTWSCLTRPDMVDYPLLSMMKQAGLTRVEFGIESGSPAVLEMLGKGARLDQIREAFAAARKVGLVTLGFAMINTPEETSQDIDMTRDEVLLIDPDFLQLSYCTPYPGTPIFDYCRDNGLLTTTDWDEYRFLRTPVIRHRQLSREQVMKRHKEIIRGFYLRPEKALRLARIALSSPGTAKSLAYTSYLAMRHILGS